MNEHDANNANGDPHSPVPNEEGGAVEHSFEEFDRSIRRVVRRVIRRGRAFSPAGQWILALAEKITREGSEKPSPDKRKLTALVSRRILDSIGSEIARHAPPGDDLLGTIARCRAAVASSTFA